MASLKEVHYFDDAKIDWENPDYERLHAAFDWSSLNVVRGESTPVYLYWPNCLARIHRYNPAAKLIVSLRHPSLRAYSHWKHMRLRNWEDLSFSQAISDPVRAERVPGGISPAYSYVERGFYAAQITAALSFFPRQQMFFIRTDRLWSRPEETLAGVYDFLGVAPKYVTPFELVVPIDTRGFLMMDIEDRRVLDAIFAQEIASVSNLTGLDLGDWLDPLYRDPMGD